MPSTFLEIAESVANLRSISRTTRNMSLSAINAKIITAHAGNEGRTFAPLTDFISQLCDDIDNLADRMSHEAIFISRFAINQMRLEHDYKRFQKAKNISHVSDDCVNSICKNLGDFSDSLEASIDEHRHILDEYLEEAARIYRYAQYININCRIEANQVPAEMEKFNAVADHMMSSMDHVMATVESFNKVMKSRNASHGTCRAI